METVIIKKWFMGNIKQDNRNFFFDTREGEVVRETAKAYLVAIECGTIDGEWEGTKNIWVPKSCTMTEAEYQAERDSEEKRFEDGCAAYEKLIAFAKANGLNVRKGMRKATIEQKLREAGIAYA